MKALLRVVLIVDALLLLAFGLLFLLTPWASLYNAMQLVQVQPALIGQAFGIALIGLAWLALHASIDGALTTTAARVVGHVNWLTGVLMLVWLLGLRTPSLTGFGQLVSVLAAAVLLIIGLGGVRLAGAVRRRDRTRGAETAAAARADKQAAKARSTDRSGSGYGTQPAAEPALPVASAAPAAGQRVEPDLAAASRPSVYSSTGASTGGEAGTSGTRDATAEAASPPRPPFHG